MDAYPGATVAAYDIARLAGVGRAAVSNWRRRFTDFPQPVGGTAASPLFSLAEVEAWLTEHAKQFTVLPGDLIWQQARGTVDDLSLGDLIGHIGAFLLFLRRDPRRWKALAAMPDKVVAADLPRGLRAVVPELPAGSSIPIDPEWTPLLRQVAAATDHDELFDVLCERYLEFHSRRYPVTPAPIAELMVGLADVADGVVLDPACGLGTLLLAARSRGARAVRGQEIDVTAARLTAARLLRHNAEAVIGIDDALRRDAFAGLAADAVICNPPFNDRSWGYAELSNDPRWEHGLPPRGEPELAWVQHCLAHVRPGRPVVIMMPASAASRRAGRRIRGNLLRSGTLRAVVGLPSSAPGAVAPDLWLLVRPGDGAPPPSHVLMVDASADLAVALTAWQSFASGGPLPGLSLPAHSRAVRIIDLLDEVVDVSSARHLTTSVDGGNTSAYKPTRIQLLAAVVELMSSPPEFVAADINEPAAMTTVGEMAKAGIVTIHSAPLKMTTDGGDIAVLTVNDVRLGRRPSGSTKAEAGSVTIQMGDVIIPASGREPVAHVAAEGDALLGPQLLLLRPDADRIDPYFLAGHLRASNSVGSSRGSASLLRTDVRRTPIPRLPLKQQQPYGEAFRRLMTFEHHMRLTAGHADQLTRLGFTGLADGTLRP